LHKQLVDIIVISISSPLKIGIYKDELLYKTLEFSGMTSDVLPEVFNKLLKEFEIKSVIYSNGPGSYMSIKLCYIFLKTLNITKNIDIFSVDGFYFNNNMPIKAIGNSFFVKEDGKISIKNSMEVGEFTLPNKLKFEDFNKKIEPIYILEAV
jgi:hypothetical protein